MRPRLAVSACLLGGALLLPAAAAAAPVMPDLVSHVVAAPGSEVFDDGAGVRRLVRFDGFIHNRGPGPLEISGQIPSAWRMTSVVQRVHDSAGGPPHSALLGGAEMIFETNDDHQHWHLQRIARYALTTPAGAEVGPAAKVGFCLVDSERVEAPASAPPVYTDDTSRYCGWQETERPEVTEGVSAGWRDRYGRDMWFQWVDVSSTSPGHYLLRMEADPEGHVLEADEANPPADVAYTLPGYVAAPGSARVDAGATVTLTLGQDAFAPSAPRDGTTLGPPRYRIEEAPAHGEIDVPVGVWLTSPTVRYTPREGDEATDRLRFSVREANTAFPRTPPVATVAIDIGHPNGTVSIGGAAERVVAGMSMQLTATLSGAEGPVAWSVDGVAGGTDTAGRITPDGLYTAPAVPPGHRVTIRATAPRGAVDAVRVEVVPRPEDRPAPIPPEQGAGADAGAGTIVAGRPAGRPLPAVALRAMRDGALVTASAYPRRSGRLRLTALAGRRAVASCRLRVRARRAYACALRLRGRARRARRITVVATLRGADGRVAQVRAAARAARGARPAGAGHAHRHP